MFIFFIKNVLPFVKFWINQCTILQLSEEGQNI
jgi:hypothetical protein